MDREAKKDEVGKGPSRTNRFYLPEPDEPFPGTETQEQKGQREGQSQESRPKEGAGASQPSNMPGKGSQDHPDQSAGGSRWFYLPEKEAPIDHRVIVEPRMDAERPVKPIIEVREKPKDSALEAERANLKRPTPPNQADDITKPTTKVKVSLPKESKPIKVKKEGVTNGEEKKRSMSDGKLRKRVSLKAPEDDVDHAIGYNIPNAAYRRLMKDILVQEAGEGAEQPYRFGFEAVTYLKIAAENFLINRFRMASIVRRARGKKTLNKIDLETVDLIREEPFLRRKSCPTYILRR